MDYTVKICGAAGQGVQTVGELLSRTFARAGYHVFTHQDYESRIRGGHNFYQIRVSEDRVMSAAEKTDIVVSLDRAGIDLHRQELTASGLIAYDADTLKLPSGDPVLVDIPFRRIATDKGGAAVMENTVATGAVLGMLGMDPGGLYDLLRARFEKKGADVIEGNLRASRAGYDYARQHCTQCTFIPSDPDAAAKLLMRAPDAGAISALASGLKFYSAYPMTPSTSIFNNIAAKAEQYGVVVEQAEDEIAAINMAIGASFSGVRAATGTSGGGFALMTEGISLAGMTETPLVVFEAQRPGPATGLPTRTEQSDLEFIIHAGHGEFPRVVLAPGSPQQMFTLVNKAFNLAEKYQITVFVLYDQYLADAQWTYDEIATSGFTYTDYRLRGDALKGMASYKRYADTDSGVSPLAIPGASVHTVYADSDEHDEDGHMIEDAATRTMMINKRLFKKAPAIRDEMSPPLRYGAGDPETVLISWGSTYGVVRETVDALNHEGKSAAMLHFTEVYPLPGGDWLKTLKAATRTVCIESNVTGQFAGLLRKDAGYQCDELITRYDGRPLSVDYIRRQL